MTDSLSDRGRRLITDSPMAEYIHAHFEHQDDSWDPEDNPDGYIGLCVAENKLVWDLIGPRLTASRAVPQSAVEYDAMIGSAAFRQQLADFLGRSLFKREVAPEHVAALGGAGSVLELLFYAIADAGDGVLVPTPSYTGFWSDLETRNELKIIPVHTSSGDQFQLRAEHLESAYGSADRPVTALLFTSPSNPLGRIYTADQIEEVLGWAEDKGIHVVFDELFALSTYGDSSFVSAAALRPALGERLHVVWAASKDLAASGLRCGVLVSENDAVIEAVDGLAYWAAVSGDTQYLIGDMISDTRWIDEFMVENRKRLGDAYAKVTAALDEASIPFLPAEAGFFVLLDLRPFLDEVTWDAEDALWRRFLVESKVNVTPGSACHNGEPGFMRLVFAGVPPEAAVAGIVRMARVLSAG
ncbi:MAG: aminotransferase class I/II-fold pyridoxal phosphate-dependent enzyme [Acidimicrobiia bacterium]|nr:aminotransferase class I/II-fold pyridoxal phosphate-dependent enzyme [Acidimicrobiia bacterium]